MKPRELNTIYDLIVANYKIEEVSEGVFRHSFHPKTTNTVYEFIADGAPAMQEGERYNIGYQLDSHGRNVVDISCLSKATEVNPLISYLCAYKYSRDNNSINNKKNAERVWCEASVGYYWGPKYAWREYGLAISQSAFRAYLDEIGHPKAECVITDPDNVTHTTNTFAYADEGLERAVFDLINTARKVTKSMYKSTLYSKRFSIRGVEAITDKK